jgi:hypothetical protein
LPHAGRHLEALRDDLLEERRRNGTGDRALLEILHECGIDGILHRRDGGMPERLGGGVAFDGGKSADQHQRRDAFRVVDCDPPRHQTAHRMTDEDGARDPERVHHADDVGREDGGAVVAGRLRRIAVPAQRHRDGPDRRRQLGHHQAVGTPRIAVAVQQKNRLTGRIAVLRAGQRDAVMKLDLKFPYCAHLEFSTVARLASARAPLSMGRAAHLRVTIEHNGVITPPASAANPSQSDGRASWCILRRRRPADPSR